MNVELQTARPKRLAFDGASLRHAPAALFVLCGTVWAGPAAALPEDEPAAQQDLPGERLLHTSPEPVRFLPGAIAAGTGSPRATGFGWGGYDGATRNVLFGASTEARLGARVVIGAGFNYAATTSAKSGALRPSVAARVQLLNQRSHGLDAGIGLAFRQDRFVEEEGVLQASVAGGWRSERLTLLGNLGYARDGEGDDHEGEIRLAGLCRVYRSLAVGFDGRVRKLLSSTDPQLVLHGTPSLEFTAGPVGALTAGSWALLVETGVSGVRRGTLQAGAIVVGGVGAVF